MQADQAMTVVDTLSALDLAYATSAQELATALQRVSSVAQTAGVSFQDLSSILTVVSSNTRLSSETIGNGLKSLFSRLQNIKVNFWPLNHYIGQYPEVDKTKERLLLITIESLETAGYTW